MAMVLVVDDDDSIRELLVKIVKLSGHEALAARNGLEAVAIFKSYQDSIDLVITDLKMPVMDGYRQPPTGVAEYRFESIAARAVRIASAPGQFSVSAAGRRCSPSRADLRKPDTIAWNWFTTLPT